MNRRVLALGIGIGAPLITVLALGFGRDPHAIESPLVGRPAPPFSLSTVETSESISLEELHGKPVVLNFWATWCVPCIAEHEILTTAARAMEADVQFLGIVYDDQAANIRSFLGRHGSAYPSLMDVRGKTAIAYGVYGVPETFFIDAYGVIVGKHEGPLSLETLWQNIQAASR